jgi:hypothetical protein
MLEHKKHQIRMFGQHRQKPFRFTYDELHVCHRTDIYFTPVMFYERSISEYMSFLEHFEGKLSAAFGSNRYQRTAAFDHVDRVRQITSGENVFSRFILHYGSDFSSFYFPFALEMTQHISLPLNVLPVPAIAVAAGTVLGIGAALVIRGKGSSGGYDIIAIILNHKCSVSIPIVVNGIDLILILSQIPGAAVINLIGGLLTIVVSTALMHVTLNHLPWWARS